MRKILSILCALLLSTSLWAVKVTSTLSFSAKCDGSGTADDGATWTVTSDASESNFDANRGVHYGTSNAAVSYLQLETSSIIGKVSKVVVTASDAKGTAAISVKVGGTSFTGSVTTVTNSNPSVDYTFTGDASGKIVVKLERASAKSALYVKSVTVEYTINTLYYQAGTVNYAADDAVVAMWGWETGEDGAWYTFKATDEEGVMSVLLPPAVNNAVIGRWAKGSTPDWTSPAPYNKTGDIAFPATYPATTNMIELNAWDGATSGTWSKYPPSLYVTGTKELLEAAGSDKAAWTANALEMADGAYTFTNLPAGSYALKVTVGDWSKTWGYDQLASGSSDKLYYKTSDKNIHFDLAVAGDVKVECDGSKVTMTGAFVQHYTPFEVKVPAGTENCYIAGSFNDWALTKMTWDVTDEVFKYNFPGVADTAHYKYCAGPAWKYEELDKDGNQIANRTYKVSDEVEKWAAVPTVVKYAKVKAAPVNWTGHYILAWSDLKPHSIIDATTKKDLAAADGAPAFEDGDTISIVEGSDYAVDIRFSKNTAGAYTIKLPDSKYIKIPNANEVNEDEAAQDLYLAYFKGTNQEGVQISLDNNFDTGSRIIYANGTNYRSYTNKIDGTYKLPVLYRLVNEAFDCADGPYAVKVGDQVDTLKFDQVVTYDEKDYNQYKVENLSLKKGDKLVIANLSCTSTLTPAFETGGAHDNFKATADTLEVLNDGVFNFYLKLRFEDDKLYIGYVPETKWYIAGDFTKWAAEMKELVPEKADSLVAKFDLSGTVRKEFKLVRVVTTGSVKDSTWFALNDEQTMRYGASTNWFLYAGDGTINETNVGLEAIKAGEYVFSVNPTTENNNELAPTVSVLIPAPSAADTTWYVAGGFTKWAAEMVELEATSKKDSLSVKIELKADTAVDFKLVRVIEQDQLKDTTWYGIKKDEHGNLDEMSYGHSTGFWFFSGLAAENVKLNPTNANDDYTFSVDVAHKDGDDNLAPIVDVIIPKKVKPVDPRAKREIVLTSGDQLQVADPSMFVFGFGNGKAAYDTVMTIKKVGDDTLYVARIPEELDSLIFVRAVHGLEDWSELVWDAADPNYNVWNQTPDLFIDCDTAVFNGWVEGTNKFDVVWCPQPIITKWYIAGGFTKWATEMVELEATATEDSLSVKIELKADTAVEFKLVRIESQGTKKDTTWFGIKKDEHGNLDEMRYGHSTGFWFFSGLAAENVKLNPTNANDDYTFSVDVAHKDGDDNLAPIVDAIIPKKVKPVDPRAKREIVLTSGDQLQVADPSMFVFGFGNGKAAYDTIMTIKKVGDDTLYVARIPEELDSLIFVRAVHGLEDWSELVWDATDPNYNVWNQTADLLIGCDTAAFEKWVEGTNKFEVSWCKEPVDPAAKQTIRLVPRIWDADGAQFAAWYWKAGEDGAWTEFLTVVNDTIDIEISQVADHIIFARFSDVATAPAWNESELKDGWNKTGDIEIAGTVFTITDWTEGTWAAYHPEEVVHYYITGNEALVGAGKDWDTEAIPVKGSDSYTFKNLAAGVEYQLKITEDGTWGTARGYSHLSYICPGETTDTNHDNNIIFTLAEAGDVVVTFVPSADPSVYTFTVIGNFVKEETQWGLLINGNDFVAAWKNPNNPVELMLTGVSLSNGDSFVLHDDTEHASWVISNYKEGSYQFTIAGDDPKHYEVTETGLYDFYVYSTLDGVDNYIYVAKQGSTGCENVYGTEVELRKVIENGVLYIYRDGKVYNIQGQLVR